MKPAIPASPASSLLRCDDLHAIDAHLEMLVFLRAQNKRALTTANRPIEVFFQHPAGGAGREHVAGQGARQQIIAQHLFIRVRARIVDQPRHFARHEPVRPLLQQDLEHVGE